MEAAVDNGFVLGPLYSALTADGSSQPHSRFYPIRSSRAAVVNVEDSGDRGMGEFIMQPRRRNKKLITEKLHTLLKIEAGSEEK